MCLAKEKDVDMIILAGDLFHDNKPSRKSMFNVMRSLRMNCYGEKPCELEMLSDSSEVFQGYKDACEADRLGELNGFAELLIMSTTKTPISMWLYQSSRYMAITMIHQGFVNRARRSWNQ